MRARELVPIAIGLQIDQRPVIEAGAAQMEINRSAGMKLMEKVGANIPPFKTFDSLKAAEALQGLGISATVADARFAKPIDRDLVRALASSHKALITIEEGSVGGFGAQVAQFLSDEGLLDGARGPFCFRQMTLPDSYIDQDGYDKMIAKAKLDAVSIVALVTGLIGRGELPKALRA